MHFAPYFGRVRLCGQKTGSKVQITSYGTTHVCHKKRWYEAHAGLSCTQKIFWQLDVMTTPHFPSRQRVPKLKFWSPLHPLAIVVSFAPLNIIEGGKALAIALLIIFLAIKVITFYHLCIRTAS
jgi:hypothetical protein